jgi:hypothetical protein
MKAALANTPKHDFALPGGEVRKVTLCSTGRPEVFIAGTEPDHVCGNGETPPPRASVKKAAVAPADVAVPSPAAAPSDSIGDGQTFQTLQNSPPTASPTR